MPPVMITMVTPIAISPMKEIWRMMLKMLRGVAEAFRQQGEGDKHRQQNKDDGILIQEGVDPFPALVLDLSFSGSLECHSTFSPAVGMGILT